MKSTSQFVISLIGIVISASFITGTSGCSESAQSEEVSSQSSDSSDSMVVQEDQPTQEVDVLEAFTGERSVEWEPREIIVKLRPGVSVDTGLARALSVTGGMDFKALERSGRARSTSGGELVIQVVEDLTAMRVSWGQVLFCASTRADARNKT